MGREFAKVGVIGLGTMGAGITEVLARSGLAVVGVEVSEEALERGRGHIEHSTARAVKRGKLTEDQQRTIFGAITFSTSLTDVKDADLVIEAVPEKLALKQRVLADLDGLCPGETILATNTSSLSVTEIAVSTSRPSRVIGMHFFNPAPIMKLIEVIATVVTDPQVVVDVEGLVQRIGKVDVTVSDKAGFIANALLFGYLNHAVSMYESRYASREDIDAAMTLGCGLPMGPLALMDLIGIDTAYEILDTMYRQGRDRLHAPTPLIKQMASAGLLGRKSGRGFYTYEQPDSPVVVPDSRSNAGGLLDGVGRPVSKVGIIGSGTMAAGLAEVFAKGGYDVTVVARGPDKAAGLQATVALSMDKAVLRGKLEQPDRDAATGRIHGTVQLDDLADCDLVIESLVEELAVKQALFAALDEVCRPGTVLASTTSSLPVVECAAATGRPRDVVGMHFFNPAPVMRLVEVVRTVSTDDEVVATARAVCEQLGKQPVTCGDRAGFIVNALLFPYLNDAVKMLEAHYASADDIDAAMTVGCGYPMGPFELLDVVGLDVALAIQRSLYLEFREPGFAPAPLLEHLVTAGYLGRKTGRGFRDYSSA
ncbi:MAG: 3-hydroxybutyryl-CoA dehydrogenase [Pseudonocardiales bacterium]